MLEALKTKSAKAEDLKAWRIAGPDLFLHLAGGLVERVELSALPASLPLPEGPQAEAPAQPKPQKRPAKRKGGG